MRQFSPGCVIQKSLMRTDITEYLSASKAKRESCSKPVENFFVIQYVWADESKIAPFPPGKTYTNRAITSAIKKLASPVARGKPMSPRDIVLEVASTIPEIDREVNPYYGTKDMRQVMTIRNTVNKNTYGEDVESYLRRKEGVILRQYQNEDGSKSENFVVVDPYHVGLIATNGDQKLKCKSIKVKAIAYSGDVDKVHASDVSAVNTGSFVKLRLQIGLTFQLCNMYLVVIVIKHPYLVNEKAGKPALLIGPTCLTQRKTKASLSVFANYLRECLVNAGVDVMSKDFRFDFITDGERALYDAFREAFPRHNHTLCVLLIRDGIKRYFLGKPVPSSHVSFVLNCVLGYHRNVAGVRKHVLGLVDSVSEEQYLQKWKEMKSSLGDDKFQH
ncbi:hypothetical protein RvY_05206 [Ramazzottius varieornatus]|uniref:Uncharacterized protein n=1 Tax=Ramazzottius varieornatus TaxID=947166 RepID=A0A1D1UXC0_RAMVA|nr:hypothetical protein RvY_05206 [Ramazzottius varieornatus]